MNPVLVRVAAAGSALVLVAGAVAAWRDGEDLPPGAARATVDGTATVEGAGGSASLEDGDIVRRGDTVSVQEGTVVLAFSDGTRLEGRGSGGDGTVVQLTPEPDLLAGELLATSRTGPTVGAAGTSVTLAPSTSDDVAVRIERDVAVTAATYVGSATVDSAGQTRDVPALRQLSIATLGRPPARPQPIRADAADPWDRRFLGAALDLDVRLQAFSRAATASFGTRQRPASFYTTALPALDGEPQFGSGLVVADRPTGELLVGAAIALLGRRDDFATRWAATFGFRDEGAGWGLVAADQGVTPGPLLGEVESAIARLVGPGPVVAAPDVGAPILVLDPVPTTAPPPTGGGPPTTGSPPTTAPPPTPPPGNQVLPETGIPPVDTILEPVDDLLGNLLP